MSLHCNRNPAESWRAAVERISSRYGLQSECLSAFDDYLKKGEAETAAAWCALYDWDCLDYVEEPDEC